jgi:nitrogen fixation/metabolism regulation signal transduction histidine kinase
MLLIIAISFFLTGTISFYHFKKENELYHEERLKRKEMAVVQSIDYFLTNHELTDNSDSIVRLFDNKICELARVNSMDINIYGLQGDLLISSRPELHEKQIIPTKIRPQLMERLYQTAEQVLLKTKGDSLEYLSTFDFLRNTQEKPVAIINLPYFDTEDVHREDLQAFLMRLGEIYFILFLAAGLIAYFLSNYITGSLQAVGAKIKSIRISEKNPPLNWKFNDEIGTLVDEYNRMVQALEKSAVKLAETERESAWKEMAKQVAHEIKNPLTPMRLNVQHLQKSLKTQETEKLKAFSQSMIDQIDTLSNIAQAFSNFASMPEIKKRAFPVQEVIARATALYPEKKVRFKNYSPGLEIKADKEQLIRVMNNLIKNALQAIPEGREEKIEIRVSETQNHVSIAVEDNGVGVSAQQADKIFEPNFTTKTRGMGLGLALVKRIISSHGGSISLKPATQQGTIFTILLPKNKEDR